ncbi:MAG: response regulator [Lachnospiraceae bacterium]|nr:response regulator [Lachnospiraceae bacterium]
MFNRVLIVAPAEGFIIKGLETKLNALGILSLYSSYQMSDLKDKCDGVDIVFIFTDDSVVKHADVFNHIRKEYQDKDSQIIVIGTKEEYDLLISYIPESDVYKMYERPLDMDQLMTEVDNFMKEGAVPREKLKSILIVDDDVAYMGIIMEWLKDKYRVSLANSGMQAITWLAKNHADLILLDYEMPITPGPQVLEMIRSDPSTAKIPVMFLTGKSDKESIMKVLDLKPVGYQLKSIDRKQLRKNIADYFASQRS